MFWNTWLPSLPKETMFTGANMWNQLADIDNYRPLSFSYTHTLIQYIHYNFHQDSKISFADYRTSDKDFCDTYILLEKIVKHGRLRYVGFNCKLHCSSA